MTATSVVFPVAEPEYDPTERPVSREFPPRDPVKRQFAAAR
ncbi:hypothetical protein [Amycolatopsis decaplanina]|nr:hypothetical protein [Amycolatopsis decaplanina]